MQFTNILMGFKTF